MKLISLLLVFMTLFFPSRPASAQEWDALFNSILGAGLSNIGQDAYQLSNPQNPKTPALIVADAIQIALGLLGIIFLALIVYAGFRWLFAGGEGGVIDKARGVLINSVIGLIIILTAYSITYFIVKNVLVATQQYSGEAECRDTSNNYIPCP